MKKQVGVLLAAALVLTVVGQALAFDVFGESGQFLTPSASVVKKGAVNFGFQFIDWPTAGKDAFAAGGVAGIANRAEFGYGVITHGNGDRNSFGLKYRLIQNKDTGFTLALGGQFYTEGGGGRDKANQDGLGYGVLSFPYQYGTLNVGGMWMPDETQNGKRTVGGFGSINYFMYPDIEFYYEIAQISRINGELFQSVGVNYKPSDKQPIWLNVGALIGTFDKARGTDTVITAGITLGYNESHVVKREEGSF